MKTMKSLIKLIRRPFDGLVRFVMHPIWHYSIGDIAGCVYRDWYGIEGNARYILSWLLRENTTRLEIEFQSKDTGETYVTIECRIKPNEELTLRNGAKRNGGSV